MARQRKKPAPAVKKPRNVAAKNLADPRYRHKVEKNPDAYTRKTKHKPGRGEVPAPDETAPEDE